ncbi:MgtC/SapB family protein [Aquirhabdus parva]|uniref:Protein MgtC n=1 Tax=Aquirhabdus parva TaxID=2283318 RepID=A0A345PA02_9GAMM|nr:MgtC/SapB family protein [Aquirhabdus parva]AXI04111.1 MgtC/SapB family protein [Aquirhabdus parva]
MHSWQLVNLTDTLDSFICLTAAFILGSLIGYERQYRQRTAGLRTNTLVAVAAASFVDLAMHLNGNIGAAQVTAYVVSGVGFLGAGTIMKEGLNVRGLNTAATLWGSAAVGACAGAHLIDHAVLIAVFVLAANTLLRPVVNSINRKPINDQSSEVTYQLHVIVANEEQRFAMITVEHLLDHAEYPLAHIDVESFNEDDVEITATLLSTSAESQTLDQITARLVDKPYVKHAFWNSSITE